MRNSRDRAPVIYPLYVINVPARSGVVCPIPQLRLLLEMVMNKFALVAVSLLATGATPAIASSAAIGSIYAACGTNNGAVLFSTTGTRTPPPACQEPGGPHVFAIDASSTAGQAAVSVLLTAKAQTKRVTIQGTGSYPIWGGAETFSYILVGD